MNKKGKYEIEMSEQKPIWNKIRILHNKANDLMKKQSILDKDIQIKYKELSKKKKTTKSYQTTKKRISIMQNKHMELSAEITIVLRKKDSLLKKIK